MHDHFKIKPVERMLVQIVFPKHHRGQWQSSGNHNRHGQVSSKRNGDENVERSLLNVERCLLCFTRNVENKENKKLISVAENHLRLAVLPCKLFVHITTFHKKF